MNNRNEELILKHFFTFKANKGKKVFKDQLVNYLYCNSQLTTGD